MPSSPSIFARIPDTESTAAVLDLNGPWQFKATDERTWMEAVVPGVVHSDLLRAGRIDDPFYRDNEFKVQWVEKKEWEYRRAFRVDEDFLRHDRILLECRGLDTIAEVYLNGAPLAKTRNMFVEYEFEAGPLLRVGENEILIVFRSILDWIKAQEAAEPRVVWNDIKGNSFFARKSGSDFGWDWGIRLVCCGIWRPIRLTAYDTGRVTELAVRQDLRDPERAVLEMQAEVERFMDGEFHLELEASLDGKVVAQVVAPVLDKRVMRKVLLMHPKLWWPNGWGEQPLYTVTATLMTGRRAVHARSVRIGLRTVELVQEKDDRGQSFGFKINGKTIFCKGANWIPAGTMKDQLSEEHYRHLLRSCKDTNMNMLRLWAGGLYEPDGFYELCDEYGLMIWHDFMFAVGPYLANESFIGNVQQEITNVVRRLRHHPSIVLWCGNNEVESGLNRRSHEFATANWVDMDKIFYEEIPQTVALHDPDRPYWPSSPHHPLDRAKQKPDYRTASGDAHVWEVWHDEERFSWYARNPDFRFVSEFGLQSFPAMETILSFTAPEDRHFVSRVLDLHNKCGKKHLGTENLGNARLAKYVASMYKMPIGLENWVYVTQIMHGEAMKVASEAYRRNYPATRGALYWQLNDNWPTISGGGIDYYGRWKALQYMTRHFFQPVLVTGWVNETAVKIWGVNDLLRDTPARLQWTLARFAGEEVRSGGLDVLLPANSSTVLAELDFSPEVGEDPGHVTYRNTNYENRSQFYLSYRLTREDRLLSANVSFFALPKYLTLEEPHLCHAVKRENGRRYVVVSAERFASYVELGLKDKYTPFSDNYFHLLPGEERTVEILDAGLSDEEVAGRLYAKSLVDSYTGLVR